MAAGNLSVEPAQGEGVGVPPRVRFVRAGDVRLMRLASVVVLLGIWELLSLRTTSLTLPAPLAVLRSAVKLLVGGDFWVALSISLQSLVIGFLLAAVLGVGAGTLVGLARRLGPALDVYLTILLAVPVAGVIPVVVMALGVGLAARVTVVIFFSVVIIAVNTAAGIRRPNGALVEMAQSFGAPPWRIFLRIVLPGAAPALMAGLRLGMGRAIVGMVTSELILLSVGVGKLVERFSSSFQTADLIAALLLLVCLGVLSMSGVQRLERRLLRWYQ